MAFDPFESKDVRKMIGAACKGKSLGRFSKTFDSAIQAKMSPTNLRTGGVSSELADQCLALAEVVAVARGNGTRTVDLPLSVTTWLENAPEFDDPLANAAKAAIDKVRTNSDAWAIAQDMGGWPEWTNYCRGLSTRLKKPAKKRKQPAKAEGRDPIRFFKDKGCRIEMDKKEAVDLRAFEAGQLTDDDLHELVRLQKLKFLLLTSQAITDKGLATLSALKQLRELVINQCQVKGRGYRDLDLPRLQRLGHGRKGANVALANCQHLQGLREIDVPSSDLTDKGLEMMAGFAALEKINLRFCEKLKGTTLGKLHALSKLKEIQAVGTAFSSAGFQALCRFPKLRGLDLALAKLPSGGVSELANLKQLQELVLKDTKLGDQDLEFLAGMKRLKVLDLASNKAVTDRTVELISKLPALEELSLASTGITKACVDMLSSMKKLKEVNLHLTSVPRAAQKRLNAN